VAQKCLNQAGYDSSVKCLNQFDNFKLNTIQVLWQKIKLIGERQYARQVGLRMQKGK